jgi:predicted phosphodiesterase
LIFEVGKDKETYGYEWSVCAEILNSILDKNLDPETYRKRYGEIKRFYEIFQSKIKEQTDNEILKEIEERQTELKKEKYKFFDERNEYNALLRKRAREEEINKIIIDSVHAINKEDFELKYEKEISKNETMIIPLNDLHCGYKIDSIFGKYDEIVLKQRLEKYLSEIEKIQKQHHCEKAIVMGGGDLISGNIHAEIKRNNNLNIIEQIVTVSEYITNFLVKLSSLFEKVSFLSVSGNHSRIERYKDSIKEERLDDIVEWYLKARLSNFNIQFDDYINADATIKIFDVYNKSYILVHGEFDNNDNGLILQKFANKPITAIFSGHYHHNEIVTKNEIKFIMSGSFIGTDNFTIQKRIFSKPEQLITIVNKDGIYCYYDISLL